MYGSALVIRRIGVDEADRYRDIRMRALAEAPEAFATTYEEAAARPGRWWHDMVAEMASRSDTGLWLAEDGERWVGLAGSFTPPDDPDVIELMQVWTDPDVRRRGVAERLLLTVIAQGAVSRSTAFELWVASSNASAIALYRSLGFAPVDGVERKPLPSDRCGTQTRMRRIAEPGSQSPTPG